MSIRPKFDTAQVYRIVADLIPTEGRDFSMKLSEDPNGNQSVILEGLTPMGRAWLPFLKDRLDDHLGTNGVAVEQSEEGAGEFAAKIDARMRDQRKASVTDIA